MSVCLCVTLYLFFQQPQLCQQPHQASTVPLPEGRSRQLVSEAASLGANHRWTVSRMW